MRRTSIDDLRRAVAILISSGTDWTDRTKRLAARAPGLDIFSQAFVLRDEAGWHITEAGRAFLVSIETPVRTIAPIETASEPALPSLECQLRRQSSAHRYEAAPCASPHESPGAAFPGRARTEARLGTL